MDERQTDAGGESEALAGAESAVLTPGPGGPMYGIAAEPWARQHPVFFGLVVAAVVFFTYQIVGSIITYLLYGAEITADNLQGMRTVTVIAQVLLLALPAVLLLRAPDWNAREALRLRIPGLRDSALVIACVLGLQLFFQGYSAAQDYVFENYLIPDSLKPLIEKIVELIESVYMKLLAMHSPAEFVVVWIVVALTPAVCEEIVFRGVIQRSFERGMRLRWAFLFSGTIFAVFHLNPVSFVPLVAIGVFLSAVVWRTGSIFTAMLGHCANNSIAVVTLYFTGSEEGLFTAAAPVTETLLLGLAGMAVFTGCFALLWLSHRPESSIQSL